MNTDRIGKKIVLLRKEHGYTQEALAELLQVSPQAVSKWENGEELFCRTKYDREILDSAEYKADKPNEFDYRFVDNWPFIISYFAEKCSPPGEKKTWSGLFRF